jgi:hypothetical protein
MMHSVSKVFVSQDPNTYVKVCHDFGKDLGKSAAWAGKNYVISAILIYLITLSFFS